MEEMGGLDRDRDGWVGIRISTQANIPLIIPDPLIMKQLQIDVHVIHPPIGQEAKRLQQVRHLWHVSIHLLY